MTINNKKVLVTGGDGFIGSHLCEMLVERGAQVKALSCYNSFNSWGWLDDSANLKDMEVVCGDIRDANFCRKITNEIDIIFHLAALIAIPYSYVAPSSYVDTNVTGTLNICQAAMDNKCERIIHTSTSEVYGTARYVPIDENHPLQPQSPYSASKIGADMIAKSFHNSFELPLIIARPFNTYGPRQSARAVIPAIITQIASGRKTIKVGDITPTRDFNFVRDTCRGFLALAESDNAIGETVNIGSGHDISIGDTLRLIQKIMAADVEVIVDNQRKRPPNSEVQRLLCDNRKLMRLTGISNEISIEKGLSMTVDWILQPKNLVRYKADIYNI